MKPFNTKLVLSALGIAMLATPALAQRPHQKAAHSVQVQVKTGMSRRLLNIEKRSVPSIKLRGVGLASKNAM